MAVGQVSLISSFKEQFTDQLTCNVCLDQYTDPKILPCHHSFCFICVEPMPLEIKDGKYYISCPTCRVDHLLPQGGAKNLPNAFHINKLLDLHKKLDSKQKLVSTPNPTQSTCPKHNDHLKVYCETCSQVICSDCTIATNTKHKEHTYYLISECYPKHHKQILDKLNPVKHKLADMDIAMKHLATREKEILQQGESIKEEINQHAQQRIDDIQRSQTYLIQQVDTIIQQKTQTLAIQRQEAQKIHTQLQTCQDTIEHNLKDWTQQQILQQKHIMMDEMKTAIQHVDPVVFLAIEKPNIEFSTNKNEMEIGVIASKTYSKATLELSPCFAKQPSIATLTLQSQDGSPFPLPPSLISSVISSPGNKLSVKCPITQTQPGKHSIAFTPSTRQDQLMVQVGGFDIPDSPFTLPVTPMRGEPVNIITGLNGACGIAVQDDGDIVVAEHGAHCIAILNKEGRKLNFLGSKGNFTGPYGVAISSDSHILVTDNHRLQKLTPNGVCIESVGHRKSGNSQLEFNYPDGIAVHPTTGQIFVADSGNNRIQVFTNDLIFSHTITPSGLFQRLNLPHDLALDNDGYLYVAEGGNHCVTKLSADEGKYIKRFGSKGSAPDQLAHPSSLTTHHNLVYVCEYDNHRVSVFDNDGNFLHHIGGCEMLQSPCGIAIDTLDNLYVSDTRNNRIVVF